MIYTRDTAQLAADWCRACRQVPERSARWLSAAERLNSRVIAARIARRPSRSREAATEISWDESWDGFVDRASLASLSPSWIREFRHKYPTLLHPTACRMYGQLGVHRDENNFYRLLPGQEPKHLAKLKKK